MELTVVLAGVPVRLSLRSPAYAACFQPFWTEADPTGGVFSFSVCADQYLRIYLPA